MKTIKILFILLFPVVLSAQGYIKLINNDFYWDIPEADMGYICQGFGENGPYRYKFNGDTVIDGVTYSKLYYSDFYPVQPVSLMYRIIIMKPAIG